MSKHRPLRWITSAAAVLVVVAFVEYLVLPRFVGFDRVLPLLRSLGAGPVVAAVALEVAALVSYSCLTRVTLPPRGRPGLGTLFRVDLTTFGFSHVAPVSGISANALRYRLLTGAGVRGPDALFTTVVQGTGSAIVLNVMLWLALPAALPRQDSTPAFAVAVVAGACLLTAGAAVVSAFVHGSPWTVRLVRAAGKRLPRTTPDRAERWLRRGAGHLRTMAHDRRLLGRALGWAVANWLLDAAALWVLLAALGADVGVVGVFVAYGVANVLGVLPMTPGGVGVVETALVTGLVGAGVPADRAVLAVLVWRLVNFWLPIPVAALTYLSLRTRRTPLRGGAALDLVSDRRVPPSRRRPPSRWSSRPWHRTTGPSRPPSRT